LADAHQYRVTIARRLKILQNDSKPAEKRKRMTGKIGGRTAIHFGRKRPKKIFYEKHVFLHGMPVLSLYSNCF
jgi:hypothetical protein